MECIIIEDFNHGQWKSLESTGGEDQQFLLSIQDSFLTQHVLEPTKGENVLDLVLSSQKEIVDTVKIHEPLGKAYQMHGHYCIKHIFYGLRYIISVYTYWVGETEASCIQGQVATEAFNENVEHIQRYHRQQTHCPQIGS